MVTKQQLAKSILYSFLSPILLGSIVGAYCALITVNGSSAMFFNVLLSAIANAHIVGLAMGVCVVPAYMYLSKKGKLNYSAILTAGMAGGALFSYLLSAQQGGAFVANAVMSALAAGIFLFSLRRQQQLAHP